MGLDPDVVERRLAKILEEVEFLRSIRKQQLKEFLDNGKSLVEETTIYSLHINELFSYLL